MGKQMNLNCMESALNFLKNIFFIVTVIPKDLNFSTFSKDLRATFIQGMPQTTNSSLPSLDKNMLSAASSALHDTD
jgi:hypothetical protein